MKVTLVPPDYLNEVWGDIKPMLEKAVKVTNGRYTTYDVYNMISMKEAQLWIAYDEGKIYGCEVTTIVDYPSKRALSSLFTAGSNIREWRDDMMEILTRWARDNGCEVIEGLGRDAWVRMLEPFGVRKVLTFFEKEV